jgi:hypothetical protein
MVTISLVSEIFNQGFFMSHRFKPLTRDVDGK